MMVYFSWFRFLAWILSCGVLLCTVVYSEEYNGDGLVFETEDAIIVEVVSQERRRLTGESLEEEEHERRQSTGEGLEEEEPDPVLADRRHPPSTEDELTTLLLSSMLEAVVNTWEGTPVMRPVLKKPPEDVIPSEGSSLAEELLDVVPERISKAGRRSSRESSTTAGLRGGKRSSRLVNTPDNRSTGNVPASESAGRVKRHRTSRERRDDKPTPSVSGGVDLSKSERREDARVGMSITPSSLAEVPTSDTTVEEDAPPTADSWRIHFPDERVQMAMKHGDRYEGRISRKLMEGDGVFLWSDGSQYRGQFVDGEMTGKGRLMWPETSWYQGDVVKAWRHGRGLYVSAVKKLAYLGDWVTGRKHGNGLLVYNEEGTDLYDGEWRDNLRDGYGLRVYPSGARYLGYWREGLRDGVGTMLFANGDVYSGGWEKGVFAGYGEYTWRAFLNRTLTCGGDNVHRGWFKAGYRDGEATYELRGGQQIRGSWMDDLKDGTASVICGDGTALHGEPMFEEDSPVVTKRVPKKAMNQHVKTTRSAVRINSKAGKLDSSLLLRQQSKSLSTVKVACSVTKTPSLNPNLILHGLYIPVHAPWQNIDLEYILAILKAFKHPTESTRSQTDDIICSDLSIKSSEKVVVDLDKKKSKNLMAVSESVSELQMNPLPNEKSTQTDSQSNNSLIVIVEEKVKSTISAGRILVDGSTVRVKGNRVSKQLVQDHSIPKNVSSGTLKEGKKGSGISARGSVHRSVIRVVKATWPAKVRLVYPAGETEKSCEERWLRRAVVRNLPAIRRVYGEYAALGCPGGDPPFQPVLLRLMLWQLYRDCGVTARVSLAQLDTMMADNPRAQVASQHYPFERILLWQFLYSLIDVSWLLYASQGLGEPDSPGVLGSAFSKLIHEDILSRPAGHKGHVLTEHLDLLPLMPVYLLYRSLGEPLSARTLLQLTCHRTGVEPPPARPRQILLYPKHIADGFNALVMVDGPTFLPQPLPLATSEIPIRETSSAIDLSVFGNVGVDGVVDVLVGVCPAIGEEGVLVNLAYEMTFLEFYEVLVECEQRSHDCEQRRLARLEALEKLRLQLEAEMIQEDEVIEIPIVVPPVKSSKVKQKKATKSKTSAMSVM